MNNELEDVISEINSYMTNVKDNVNSSDTSELPSNLKLMMTGAPSNKAIDFLFSIKADQLIEKILDLVNSGKLELLISNQDKLINTLNKFGFGSGSFEGPVSTTIVNNISNIVNSPKYARTKSSFRKMLLVYKKLKSQKDKFRDPYTKAKYEQSLYAILQVAKIIRNIWKNRKLVNDKMIAGLKGLVTESEDIIHLVRLTE